QEHFLGALTPAPHESAMLALAFAQLPPDTELFVTARDLPTTRTTTALIPTAVAIRTEPNGLPSGPAEPDPTYRWHNAIPLVRVEHHLATWQLISSPHGRHLLQPRFGIVTRHPVGALGQLIVAGGLAPFFASAAAGQPSATLPVPRFTPGTKELVLLPQ